jgi:two-component system, LuxR family, sensor histidine kinase DctS
MSSAVQDKICNCLGVLERAPMAVIAVDLNGCVQSFNQAASQFFGYSVAQAASMGIAQLFDVDQLGKRSVDLSINLGFDVEVGLNVFTLCPDFKAQKPQEWTAVTASGDHRIVELQFTSLVEDESLFGYLIFISDITGRKNKEKQLEEQKLSLIASSKMASLGEMSAGVAHEINNPVAIIRGKAELVIRMLKTGKIDFEKAIDHIDRIVAMTTRIQNIVQGLRSFAREDYTDPFKRHHVKNIIDEVVGVCGSRFEHSGVKLEVGPIDPSMTVDCRAVQIHQVLLNLLSNSFDAVAGQEESWVKIEVQVAERNTNFIVSDSGFGIPENIADKIMNPFFTTKEPGKGTGLGLSISRGMAEQHGGTLWLDKSAFNTSFVLTVPTHRAHFQIAS